MATINLAPGTQYLTAIRRRRRFLYGLSAVVIALVVLIWATLFFMNQAAARNLQEAQGELSALERRIAEAGPDVERITLFEQRLAAVDSLLDRHSKYSVALLEIERLLPPPTVLTNLNIDTRLGVADIVGKTPTIDEVAQTLASLATTPGRTTIFKEAELQSILRNEVKTGDVVTGVEYVFKARLPFNPSILSGSTR